MRDRIFPRRDEVILMIRVGVVVNRADATGQADGAGYENSRKQKAKGAGHVSV